MAKSEACSAYRGAAYKKKRVTKYLNQQNHSGRNIFLWKVKTTVTNSKTYTHRAIKTDIQTDRDTHTHTNPIKNTDIHLHIHYSSLLAAADQKICNEIHDVRMYLKIEIFGQQQ